MNSCNAVVFNLQKFCVHDGPGIRTTLFFKGCPLQCIWCHNPESQAHTPELLFDPEKCTGCGRCAEVCPQAAIVHLPDESVNLDRTHCVACGKCVDACLNSAREISGYQADVKQLLSEVEKDQVFYEQSGGGITFSGGEALCQLDAVESIARAAKLRGIHVAMDTCGHVPFSFFERILDCVDLFLYDIKHIDPKSHRQYTGQDNHLILENLRRLSEAGAAIFLRLPLVEGINADDDNITQVISFIRGLRIQQVNLLPYHNTGSSKHLRMGHSAPSGLAAPTPERLEQIKAQFQACGLPVYIGG